MHNVPVYRIIRSVEDRAIDRVRQIYESAFPECERKPTSCFDEMLSRSDYAVIVAEVASQVVGFAAVFVPAQKSDASLLEYLAVDRDERGRGIGHGLLQVVSRVAGGRPVLAEIESSTDEAADRRRRFYLRAGFVPISGLAYILPLPNAPPMQLLIGGGPSGPVGHQLVRWLRIIYERVYEKPHDDPRLLKMITDLERDSDV